MITENAIIVSIENDQTWIETQRKSTCGECSASKAVAPPYYQKLLVISFQK